MFDISSGKRKRKDGDFPSLITDFFNDNFLSPFDRRFMRVDIRDDGKNYILEAEIPGVKKEDIAIDIDNDVLKITVDEKEDYEEKSHNFIRRERRFGTMSRSFAIPDIDIDNVKAEFIDGILILSLPKFESSEAVNRKIDIE